MGKAYREGWDRIFGPKPPPELLPCTFPLRSGLNIRVELPRDLVLKDLPRFVWYLVTMCDDWNVDDGFPSFAWPESKKMVDEWLKGACLSVSVKKSGA